MKRKRIAINHIQPRNRAAILDYLYQKSLCFVALWWVIRPLTIFSVDCNFSSILVTVLRVVCFHFCFVFLFKNRASSPLLVQIVDFVSITLHAMLVVEIELTGDTNFWGFFSFPSQTRAFDENVLSLSLWL